MKRGKKLVLLVLLLCLVVGVLLRLNALFRNSAEEDTGAGDIVPIGKESGSDTVPDNEQEDYMDDIFWTDLY